MTCLSDTLSAPILRFLNSKPHDQNLHKISQYHGSLEVAPITWTVNAES